MNLLWDLHLGIIIGLAWASKSLLSKLPSFKAQFFVSSVCLYYLTGGLSSGKLKLVVGFLTYFACKRSDLVLGALWEPAAGLFGSAAVIGRELVESSSSASRLPQLNRSPDRDTRY